MTDLDLFGGDERYLSQAPGAQADRLFAAWRSTPECRPLIAGTKRERIVKHRITQAIEAGYDREVILQALEDCWKYESERAWQTSLDIARRSYKPNLSDTQSAILRLRQRAGAC